MKIRIIGGGPAGLFFAYLMARADAGHDIRVYERNAEGATYGWGLVFSDVALSFVREVAPEVYESITQNQIVFDAMSIVHQGQHVRLAGNTFHRMARIDLLRTLHRHCRRVGVSLHFERPCDDVAEFSDCDVIVAADGANSSIRARYREEFGPTLDQRPNLLAWYGTTRLFEPLSLIFRQTRDGLIIAHCYQFSRTHSTFLVEVPPDTFRTAGLDRMVEAESLAYCEAAFAEDLDGHRLLSNRSNWFRYTIVKNRAWYFDNVVLLGDALRTGHPSIGSGTRLAMQDSIALFDACRTTGGNVPLMLEEFCRVRRPGSDALQQAAIKSTEWYEHLGDKMHLDPISFAHDYLRRSGRVSHADIRQRDPALASAYEKLHPTTDTRGGTDLYGPRSRS
jgi:2-polyprenyl-6-methoxyphenol hydroxylase-like FAD-dependent oxidoreductase